MVFRCSLDQGFNNTTQGGGSHTFVVHRGRQNQHTFKGPAAALKIHLEISCPGLPFLSFEASILFNQQPIVANYSYT